jgi:hypothetical protein
MKNECRYIVTDVVSIPVLRLARKGEAYRMATGDGWGVVEWYSPINNYSAPVIRDNTDKTQVLYCDDDSSAVLYPRYGREFVIAPYEEIILKDAPKQAETEAIIISDSCGFIFWEREIGNVKIFATYDDSGLIDDYRLDNWNGKPYDGETEIAFGDLQSEQEYETIDRADIKGTFENSRGAEAQNDNSQTPKGES